MDSVEVRIATELGVETRRVAAAVQLLDEGATVPFIARYRKEATGALDDTQLRNLAERLRYLRELEERRSAILRSLEEQGNLAPALEVAIREAPSKVELEDLYLPFRPKRRNKAMEAKEAGLEPLALGLLERPDADPVEAAAAFVNAERGIASPDAALEGARAILIERFAEDAALLAQLRAWFQRDARVVSKLRTAKRDDVAARRFSDYFDHSEPLARVPGHRALAMFRARSEDIVDLWLTLDEQNAPLGQDPDGAVLTRVLAHVGIADRGRKADAWLLETARQSVRTKLVSHLSAELMVDLRARAEQEAIEVFAANLRDLLLAAPAGPQAILGLDPGIRTGCKIAVVDRTGKLLATSTIYPHAPRNDRAGALRTLSELCAAHHVALIAIGNGTASRETDALVAELLSTDAGKRLRKLVVSEAGASVYSASERAAQEFPDLDVSLRGAVSIARRVQDPLAELVKIEPKAIGVGQYQHDLNQSNLSRALDAVVEDCVNHVGVDLNTASEDLLARVAGLGTSLAKNIVTYRNARGAFLSRSQLREVPRLGPKAFEQCAGFLRVPGGENPLDRSAVHPEAYPVVERILARSGRTLEQVLGDSAFLRALDAAEFIDDRFGLPTVVDIIAELDKPGRDPRPEFKTARFREGVQSMSDLEPGMQIEGVVTNVTNFGAFVDIGVHQDGLVHISQMSDRFVRDPREIAKAGQIVSVEVLEVDLERKRISLTMKLQARSRPAGAEPDARSHSGGRGARSRERGQNDPKRGGQPRRPQPVYALADQLAKLKLPRS